MIVWMDILHELMIEGYIWDTLDIHIQTFESNMLLHKAFRWTHQSSL